MNNQLQVKVQIERLGTVILPDVTDKKEAGGMLNPASVVIDKEIFVYPRAVQKPNISRMARVRLRIPMAENQSMLESLRARIAPPNKTASPSNSGFDDGITAERMGYGLVPQSSFEFRQSGGEFGVGYGVEDARITYISAIGHFVACYTAFGPQGPRCAMALSKNGLSWRRLGLVQFAPQLDLDGDDKDGVLFPDLVFSPKGTLSFAYYHRPMHPLDIEGGPEKYARVLALPAEQRDCTRIAYIPAVPVLAQMREGKVPTNLLDVQESVIVLPPDLPWGKLKNGAGTPPIATKWGFVSFFHGVDAEPKNDGSGKYRMLYRGGLIVHDRLQPHKVKYVSPQPVLSPESPDEKTGIVDNVVFPTSVTPFDQAGNPTVEIAVEQQGEVLTLLLLWGGADFVINGGLVTLTFSDIANGGIAS